MNNSNIYIIVQPCIPQLFTNYDIVLLGIFCISLEKSYKL